MAIFKKLITYVLLLQAMVGLGFVHSAFANTDADVEDIVALGQAKQNVGQPIVIPALPSGSAQPQPKAAANDDATPPATVDVGDGKRLKLPNLNSPVVDVTGALSDADKQQLAQKLRQMHTQGLVQMGIVVVPTTGVEDIFSYSVRIFDTWKLGTAAADNGLLLVVALQDRKMQMLTGYGVEGVIPDVIAKRIISDTIKPYFKQQDYAGGLMAGVQAVEARLTADPDTLAQAEKNRIETQKALQQQGAAMRQMFFICAGLLLISLFLRPVLGRFLSASGLGVAAGVAGVLTGAGIAGSLFFALGVFVILLIGIGNVLMGLGQMSGGLGGGSSGGGYSGGGGGFGGGGASDSW